jgi:hypothetical protein
MKRYIFTLKGNKNIGKTKTLKLLINKLANYYNHYEIYKINNCKYEKFNLTEKIKNIDIIATFNIDNKNKIIISTSGDNEKCIDNFLKKFNNSNVFIGITACQCKNLNNTKYKKIKNFVEKNPNIELIEIANNINAEYKNLLNNLKAEEILNLIKHFIILKQNNIYSMLSDEEKLNLYYLAKNLNLKPNSVIVEYGVFLGGSLQFIIKGLQKNKTYNNNYIFAIDKFSIDNSNYWFHDFKERFESIGLTKYIYENKIDWFDYVKNNFKNIKNLELIKSSHNEFKLNNKYKISLLHLDLAKRFKALKEIFLNLEKNIDSNTIIIHQDFFYLFSGEVIAFIYKMLKEDKIEIDFISSFGSIYLKNSKITKNDLKNFDIFNTNLLINLINESIDYFSDKINIWQKASLYAAIINILKYNNQNYNFYLKKLNELKNEKTSNHINRILKQLENNKILFKGYL